MADPNQEVQFSFAVNTQSLQQSLSEAEQLMAQGVQRMNNLPQPDPQQPQQPVTASPQGAPPPVPPTTIPDPSGGTVPPPPPPPTPPKPPSPDEPEENNPIASAKAELERIKSYSRNAPDVALAALMGQGGLGNRVAKAAIADPDKAEEYQQMLEAIKELTKSLRDTVRQGEDGGSPGGAVGMLKFIRNNQFVQGAGDVARDIQGGNPIGAVTGAASMGLSMLGPQGAAAGAILQIVGAGVSSLIQGAEKSLDYTELTTDIAARYGDFDEIDNLKVGNVNAMDRNGYTVQETAQLADMLRRERLSDGFDNETKELIESIQQLTRATGVNTEALVSSYRDYSGLGGEGDINSYMAQMIAGAVSTGMRSNLDQYMELVGSARMGLVYRSTQGDTGDGALKAIQGTLVQLMGNSSRTAELLRDNPAMTQQMLAGFLATGGAEQYSYDSAAMQMAGIARGKTDTAYATPEQLNLNALQRSQYVLQQFTGTALQSGALGYGSMGELQQAAAANPNLLQDLISSSNPNSEQAAALQDMLNTIFYGQYGKNPEAQDVTMLSQLATTYLTQGSLSPDMQTASGETVKQLLEDYNKTDADRAREADATFQDNMLEAMSTFEDLLIEMKQLLANISEGVKDISNFLSPLINAFTGGGAQQYSVTAPSGTPGKQVGAIDEAVAKDAGLSIAPTEDTAEAESDRRDLLINPAGPGPQPEVQSQELARQRREQTGSTDLNWIFPDSWTWLNGEAPTAKPNDSFKDTPATGVVASPGYNVFEFAYGDVVYASQQGQRYGKDMPDVAGLMTEKVPDIPLSPEVVTAGGRSDSYNQSSQSVNASIVVNLQVPNGADYGWVEGAAKQGTESGLDEFLIRWQGRDRGGSRIDNPLY